MFLAVYVIYVILYQLFTGLFATGNNVTHYRYIQYLTRKYSRETRAKNSSVQQNSLTSLQFDFLVAVFTSGRFKKLFHFVFDACFFNVTSTNIQLIGN